MRVQNSGLTNKEHYGMLWYFLESLIKVALGFGHWNTEYNAMLCLSDRAKQWLSKIKARFPKQPLLKQVYLWNDSRIVLKSLRIIFITYIIMSETFIKIDSLQHLEISRQTYPTNWSKIRVTTFTVLTLCYFFQIISMTSKWFQQLEILSVTFVFISKPTYQSNSVHWCRNFDSQNHYRHPCNTLQRPLRPNYNFSSVYL